MTARLDDAFAGTLALARGDRDWDRRLPMSAEAVFGSFWAMALAVPAIAVFVEAVRRAALANPDAAELVRADAPIVFVGANVLAALLSWTASLLVLGQLASRSGEGWRISPLVVGYNWSRLIVNLVGGLGGALAIMAGAGAGTVIALTSLVLFGLTIWLDIGVVRHGLGLTLGRTIGALAFVLLARVVASAVAELIGRVITA